jgi:hypothetical protein
MIQYQVVEARGSMPGLIEVVNDLLRKGWHLAGGISADQGYVYQAMIKEENVVNVVNADINNVMQSKQQPKPPATKPLEGKYVKR